MKRNRKISIYLIILSVSVVTGFFVRQISVRILLKQTFVSAIEEFQSSIETSPVCRLAEIMANSPGVELNADLNAGNNQLKIHILYGAKKALAAGTISGQNEKYGCSAFIDSNALAVSCDTWGKDYYGITFDSFAQDIQRFPMLKLIPDSLINTIEESFQKIRKIMEERLEIPNLSAIEMLSSRDFSSLFMIMPMRIRAAEVIARGQSIPATRVVYQFNTDMIPRYTLNSVPAEPVHTDITACFYLRSDKFLISDIAIRQQNDQYVVRLETDRLDNKNIIRFMYEERNDNEVLYNLNVQVQNDDYKAETWSIYNRGADLDVFWNADSNEMILSDKTDTHTFGFQSEDQGFLIKTTDLSSLLKILGITEEAGEKKISGKILMQSGQAPKTPEYKNLDQWTLEDILNIIDGVGSMTDWKFFSQYR